MKDEWFTVETIDAQTFAISEYRHWEQAHSYLLLGARRALLIDTGLGIGDIRRAVRELTQLPVTVVTTHVHWDHIGGHASFEDVRVHALEEGWLNGHFPLPASAVRANLTRETCAFPENFDPQTYTVVQRRPTQVYEDGDVLELGGRSVRGIHTPGHSPGHCCFYEEKRGFLFAGDLLYAGCLDAFYPTTDPMAFARSVRRICELGNVRILPGHYALRVPENLAKIVDDAFAQLAARDLLRQGSGVFSFGPVDIHL